MASLTLSMTPPDSSSLSSSSFQEPAIWSVLPVSLSLRPFTASSITVSGAELIFSNNSTSLS